MKVASLSLVVFDRCNFRNASCFVMLLIYKVLVLLLLPRAS